MHSSKKTYPWTYLPPFLLVLSVFVFFSEILLTGKPLFGSDFVLFFHPWKQFLYERFQAEGTLPLWLPHVFSGTPYLADLQTSMFYPLGFLFFLLPSKVAYGYTIILHWILGILFMYALARHLGMGKAGASLASIVFAYNGYVVGHMYAGHLTFVQNYFWIPLIFLYAHKFTQTLKLRYALWSGLFLGIQILGGFPQIAFYTILSILLFYAYALFIPLAPNKKISKGILLWGALLFLLLGFSLASVQLFPSYEFTGLSPRAGGVSYEFATVDSFPPVHFWTLLMPNLFGSPANATYWKTPEIWRFWELCGYVGIGPLLLLLFLANYKHLSRIKYFFLSLWALSLFLALGEYNPLYRIIYYLPGFHHFRIPAQILFLHVFSVSILAGMAMDRLCKKGVSSMWFLGVAGLTMAILSTATWGYYGNAKTFFQTIMAIARPDPTVIDLGAKVIHTVPPSIFTATGLVFLFFVVLYCRSKNIIKTAPFVLLVVLGTVGDLWSFALPLVKTARLDSSPPIKQLLPSVDDGLFRVITMGREIGPVASILHGYQDVHGYNPMVVKRYLEYINKSQKLNIPPDAVNVRYVTDWNNPMVRLLNVKYAALDRNHVHPLKPFFPRAFIVHEAHALPSEAVLDYISSPEFSPLNLVVLEKEEIGETLPVSAPAPGNDVDALPEPESTAENTSGPPEESCKIVHFSQNEIRLHVTMNKAGYLVLSEIHYPGWMAYTNGNPVNILTGNYLFRTIPLPRGTHDVTVRFEPRSFKWGTAVSMIAIFCFIMAQASLFLRRRRR